jgi:hypothetical protein
MSCEMLFVGAMQLARPGAIGNYAGYCANNRATHRVAPTGSVGMIRQKLGGLGYGV